ncbi:MAG: hypothetical protein ACXW2I_13670, partial [Burkholderiales bacterium]
MFWFDQALNLISAVYVLLFLACAAFTLWFPKSYFAKAIGFVIVSALFTAPVIQARKEEQEALAHKKMIGDRFMKLCNERAGEKIHKVVEGVEGFLILRPRYPTQDLQ